MGRGSKNAPSFIMVRSIILIGKNELDSSTLFLAFFQFAIVFVKRYKYGKVKEI